MPSGQEQVYGLRELTRILTLTPKRAALKPITTTEKSTKSKSRER